MLCPARQADWEGLQQLFSCRCARSLCRKTFSKIVDRNGYFHIRPSFLSTFLSRELLVVAVLLLLLLL